MVAKRIVSFLPSATELIYELGAQDNLVGVTHECSYPEQARAKLRVINSVFDPEMMTSMQIDQKVSQLKRDGDDVFVVMEENLRKADPDLIIGQGTCAVCSAYTNQVKRALEILQHRPQVEVLDPHSVDDILGDVMTIAKRIGREAEGERLVKSLSRRIDCIKNEEFGNRPRVLCIEWADPFFTSGHWVPQMVEVAGGTNLISSTGEHSRRMTIEEVEDSDPDVIVMMPCGFDAERTARECTSSLANNQRWKDVGAVKRGDVYGVDANSFFSKPSIRTVTGIEILAKILHPREFEGIVVPENSFSKLKF